MHELESRTRARVRCARMSLGADGSLQTALQDVLVISGVSVDGALSSNVLCGVFAGGDGGLVRAAGNVWA